MANKTGNRLVIPSSLVQATRMIARRLPQRVDLVTANFDTLNHLINDGELPVLFQHVYDHLRPGGHFMFDFITPCGGS